MGTTRHQIYDGPGDRHHQPDGLQARTTAQQASGARRLADCFRLLERRRDATLIAVVVARRRCREAAGAGGGVSPHPLGAGGQTCLGQDGEPGHVLLAVVQRAPLLQERAIAVCAGGPAESRGHEGPLHETLALAPRAWERT